MRFRFHHQHGVDGSGDHEVELRLLHLFGRRVQHIAAVDMADAGCSDRAHEGYAGEGQRRRGGDHADDVGIVLKVVRENRDDDLRPFL